MEKAVRILEQIYIHQYKALLPEPVSFDRVNTAKFNKFSNQISCAIVHSSYKNTLRKT